MVTQKDKIAYGVRFKVTASGDNWVLDSNSKGQRIMRYPDGSYKINKTSVASNVETLVIGDECGLVMNPGSNLKTAYNSFDYIFPFSDVRKVNVSSGVETAEQGDVEFKLDGSNGDVMIAWPKTYIKYEIGVQMRDEPNNTSNTTTSYYEVYWFCKEPCYEGFYLPACFRVDGTEEIRDWAYIAAYEGFFDSNSKIRSISFKHATASKTRSSFRTAAKSNSGHLQSADMTNFIQTLMYIVYGTKNIQSRTKGFTNAIYNNDYVCAEATTSQKYIIMSTAQANAFILGEAINIGTSLGSSSVLAHAHVVSKDDTYGMGLTKIYIDKSASTAIGNIVWNDFYHTGICDEVLSTVGSYQHSNETDDPNTDGKHPFVFYGIENFFGNYYKFIDGIGVYKGKVYVCNKPSIFAELSTSAINDNAITNLGYNYDSENEVYYPAAVTDKEHHRYHLLGYTIAQTNGYVSNVGYDKCLPYAPKFPKAVSGSDSTYYADYYYITTSGLRTVLFGGRWNYGSDAGACYWALNHDVAHASLSVACRFEC